MSAPAASSSLETLLRWLLAIGLGGLLLIVFSPSWGAFLLWSRVPELGGMIETRRAVSVLAQLAQPGSEVADELHRAIQWRIFFPLIGRVLHLPTVVFFGLAHLGAFLVLAYLVRRLRSAGFTWSEAGASTLALGATSWFFTATGWLGYFDSWLALGLLVTAFSPATALLGLACLLTPWIDERFVIAAPLALLCRWLLPPSPHAIKRDVGVAAGLLSAFLFTRLGLLAHHSAAGATLGGYLGQRDYLDAPISRIIFGVWEGLRAGWFFTILGVYALRRQRGHSWALGGTLVATALTGLATAQDYSRSLTMLFPAAVLGLLLTRAAAPAWWPYLPRGAAAVALLLPAHHVMNDAVAPIFNLQHALHFVDQPPAIAMPELYELRAFHAMARAEYVKADADLALAIKLAANPASPAKQRGILAASQGRWTDARIYFLLMAKHDPKNPDAWLMCAQASHALAEPAVARTELNRALELAPADWRTRPDVARFLAKIGPRP